MTRLVFIDTETTSLRPDRRAWDIGYVIRDEGQPDREHGRFVAYSDLDLGNADPMSLKIGQFYERHPQVSNPGATVQSEAAAMEALEVATRDAILVGAVPNFDAEVLGARMRWHGICPSWHYHLVDVETLAAGRLRKPPRWDFDALLADFGLTYDEADRHTALGDARMVRDLYDAVLAS